MKKSERIKTAIASVLDDAALSVESKIEVLETLFDEWGHAKWHEKMNAERAATADNE